MKNFLIIVFAFLTSSVLIPTAKGDFLTFDLEWQGGSASATGLLTIDDQIFPNPGFDAGPFATLGIVEFEITITGANGGNGFFQMNDFEEAAWSSGGVELDFTQELVGQPTLFDPWGTPSPFGGDFNVFGSTPNAPVGVSNFLFATNGGTGNTSILQLTSFAPTVVPEPSLNFAILIGLMTISFLRDKRR